MPVTIQDILKINIVLLGIGLLKEPDELKAFRESVASDVIVSGAGLAIGMPGAETARRVTMNRDRIELDLSPSLSVIGRDYPAYGDLDRLAEVVGYALDNTNLKGRAPQSFGYNIELVYSQTPEIPSLRYLADRLFTSNSLGNEGWKLVGGTGRLVFDGDGAQWTVAVEPRFNDETAKRIFLSLNLHRVEQRLPSTSEVETSFREVWNQAHSFATRLDESV